MTHCYCGSDKTYAQCCEPFHSGKSFPETAEKLMRSRYSAYAVNKIDYIAETNDPTVDDDFDRESAAKWAAESEWLGLKIIATAKGKPGDSEGEVEFNAQYKDKADGQVHDHHEVSLFRFDAPKKRWYYRDGKTIRAPEKRVEPKVGRNDPCTCGSGKKSKKCCAA